MKSQLLCTFTFVDIVLTCISAIHKTYEGKVDNLHCYTYVEVPKNVICIYNVDATEKKMRDTISINRKKETNSYYSINALNAIIKENNNGVLDKSFPIDWTMYENTLLLSDNNNGCRIIKIKELSF